MLHLVKPSAKYKESFLEALVEYEADTTYNYDSYGPSALPKPAPDNFEQHIRLLRDNERGERLPENFVPASEFWLVEGDKYLGTANIRHKLNTHLLNIGGHIGYRIRPSERKKGYGTLILKLALHEAKKLGVKRTLVTCDNSNIASARIIEKNGGVFENEFVQDPNLPNKKRYWVQTE